MKTTAKRASKPVTTPANPADRKALVARFAREFMVKPRQPTFDAVGELLRMRGHSQ